MRKIIQKAIDHARTNKFVLEGMDESQIQARVVIKLQFSTVGATGSGSMQWFLGEEGIRSCAQADGVESSLVLQIICRGNLDTIDNDKADLNEFIALKHIYVLSSGGYRSPLTGNIQPVVSDALSMSSNQNCFGNMTSLEQLLSHQGHCDYFLYHSPAGAKMRERLIDILTVEYDMFGDPLNVLTMSRTCLSRDSSRVLGYCRYMAAGLLAIVLAAKGSIEKVRQYAAGIARQSGIVESDEDNQITKLLTHPAELEHEDVVEAATAGFVDGISGTRGIEKAAAIENRLKSTQEGDIPEIYQPCMRNQAHTHTQNVIAGLERNLERIMRTSYGLWEAQKLFAFLKSIADRSLQALMQKANELREFLRPHEEIIAEASEQIGLLQQSGRLNRMVNFSLIGRLSSTLMTSGRAAISYQLQIATCEIAVQDVLTPLIDYLDRRLAWLSGMSHKLAQVAQICKNKAESVAAKSTILNVPLGIELTTPAYLKNYFQDHVHGQGGRDNFANYLLSRFLAKHGSLASLAEASLDEFEEAFTCICEDVFRPDIENTDVIGEFKRLYPDKSKQRRIIRQLIRESEGSLRITGEVNKSVAWLKGANVSKPEYVDWFREILESVDKKSGKWEVAVDNDPDRITIAQLRGGISLKPFIERVAPPDNPEGWAKRLERAPDPVSILIVNPNPNPRQFRRVLAQAIVNGQLTVGKDGCYVLTTSSGQPLILGKTFESVHAALQPKWRELVFIESTFGYNLVVTEEEIVFKLTEMKAEIQSGNAGSDPRLGLIDLTAVDECLIQADLMLRRLRRIRKANQKRLAS